MNLLSQLLRGVYRCIIGDECYGMNEVLYCTRITEFCKAPLCNLS